ncbi:hypothetical protein D3C84_1057500 [compost metagenome]
MPVNVSEDLLNLDADLVRRRKAGMAHILDRISAAHGRAAEGFQSVAVAAGGQHDDQSPKAMQPPLEQILHLQESLTRHQG